MFNAQDDIRGLLIARRADCAVSLVARTAPWCAHVPFSAQPQSLVDLICRHFFCQIEDPACRRIGRGTPKPQAPPYIRGQSGMALRAVTQAARTTIRKSLSLLQDKVLHRPVETTMGKRTHDGAGLERLIQP